MVRIAREEVRYLFGIDLDRLLGVTSDLTCGTVKLDGVLWHKLVKRADRRLEWFLMEMARTSDHPSLFYVELGLTDGALPSETAELLPAQNRVLWRMTSEGRLMLVFRPRRNQAGGAGHDTEPRIRTGALD